MKTPGYTFVSVSTAKPGKLDDLVALASGPSEKMEGKVPGMLARQVGVDEQRNCVVVWVTFDQRSSLYDWRETEQGKRDHGEGEDVHSIIDAFAMYDLRPKSQRF